VILYESKASERAAYLAWKLASGERLRPVDIMESCSVSRSTAYRDVSVLSRVLPLTQDEEGYYYLLNEEVVISPY
jgi:predicted DNA-binding transcriptional regulator YafY